MKTILFLQALILLAAGLATAADREIKVSPDDVVSWSPEVVKAWEAIPHMESGRVKPLFTQAKYELKQIRGLEGVRLQLTNGEKVDLSPMEWMLTTFFYPEKVGKYPLFLVPDAAVLIDIGLDFPTEVRWARYTYDEIYPKRMELYDKAGRYMEIEAAKRNLVQEGVVRLENAIRTFEFYSHALDLGRGIPISQFNPNPSIAQWKGHSMPVSEGLKLLAKSEYWQAVSRNLAAGGHTALSDQIRGVHTAMYQSEAYRNAAPQLVTERALLGPAIDTWFQSETATVQGQPDLAIVGNMAPYLLAGLVSSEKIGWYAPLVDHPDRWATGSTLVSNILQNDDKGEASLKLLNEMEAMVGPGNHEAVQAAALKFAQSRIQAAKDKGVYGTTASERLYHKANLFYIANWTFVLLFVIAAISWLNPSSGWSRRLHAILRRVIWLPWVLLVAGIAWRSLIMMRPPVTSLYETIPFITATAILMVLGVDAVFKTRIAIGVACSIGAAGLFMAAAQEANDASDTMQNLEPVLRSAFWLWTHVTTITLGYAAVLVTASFSIVYLVYRLFDLSRQHTDVARMLTKCSYGILCFSLFFSLVGTVLGGIWGNDSWGRFWGWDPKENGALLICLWCLAVLHMRLAGWIKEFGLHICSIFGANFVIFSWRHVNQLGVGLHSYGFTSGELRKIYVAYGVVTFLALAGIIISMVAKSAQKQAANSRRVPSPNLPAAGSLST